MRCRGVMVLAILVATACNGRGSFEPQVSAVLDETFQLRVGQQVLVGSEPLRLSFEAVPEDSRCPTDVVCVWQGNARVRLRVTRGTTGGETVNLNTSTMPPTVSVFSYEITLERLEPQPHSESRIPQDQYVAYLKVNKP